jgi:DNA-binding HxlR family transcriptional regulator
MLKRRWSSRILRHLDKGLNDPADILRNESTLSPAVMCERLRTMLRYSLIARFPRPAPSKVVEFRVTPRGKKILKMLDIIDRLDQLDQHLTIDGASIEDDLGLPIDENSSCPGRGEPAVSERSAKRRQPVLSSLLTTPPKQIST